MKKANKIFSVVLAVVLVLAMAVPAYAAGDGKITIKDAYVGQTYSIYQMLKFTPTSDGADTGIYTIVSGWADFFATTPATDYFTVSANGEVSLKDDVEAVTPELAKEAVAYAKSKVSATDSSTASSATVEFDNLELGYYAVDTTTGTICSLTKASNEEEALEKNTLPEIKKEVKEDSTGAWGATNDAQIGEDVEYKATVTIKPGATKYIIHDVMDRGLTFKDDVEIEGLTEGTDYDVSTDNDDDCTFEITFDEEYLGNITADTTVVITYSAKVNKDAEIVTDTNDNKTWLTFGDNNTPTAESITKTLVYKFNLIKTDGSNKLDGAEFELYANDKTTLIPVVLVSEGVYRLAAEGETGVKIVAGEVVINGLDADTYYLKETKAPVGYNLLTALEEVVVEKGTVDGDTVTFTASEVEVVNNSGTTLPETGGIGTTIFYIVGGLLVVGAAILLITKRRMSAEA